MENNILVEITLVISFIILTIMLAFMISGIISFVNAVRFRIKQRKIEKMMYKINKENIIMRKICAKSTKKEGIK